MNLHVPTLLIALLAGFLMLCVQLAVAQRGVLKQPALHIWAQASWALLGGYAFLGARVMLPMELSIVLGNALVCLGLLLYNQALSLYLKGHRISRWAWGRYGLALLLLVLMLPATLAQRTALVSALLVMLLLPSIWLVLRHGPRHEVSLRMVGLTLTLSAFTLAWRSLHALIAPQQYQDLLQPNPVQGLTFLVSFLGLLGAGFGFVLAGFERLALRMEEMATLDGLTGCLNRSTTDRLLAHNLERGRREGSPLAFALLDLDHFKQINDRHGHRAGDEALCAVVQAIRQRLRAADVLGRMGGEEFGLVLPMTDEPGALRLLDEVRDAIARLVLQDAHGQPIGLSVSAGVAVATVGSGLTAERIYVLADQALYRAKHEGRNCVRGSALPAAPH